MNNLSEQVEEGEMNFERIEEEREQRMCSRFYKGCVMARSFTNEEDVALCHMQEGCKYYRE